MCPDVYLHMHFLEDFNILLYSQAGKASDDLLQLGNPFADIFSASAQQPIAAGAPAPQPTANMWMSNGKQPIIAEFKCIFSNEFNVIHESPFKRLELIE